jgi:hypothetical protein
MPPVFCCAHAAALSPARRTDRCILAEVGDVVELLLFAWHAAVGMTRTAEQREQMARCRSVTDRSEARTLDDCRAHLSLRSLMRMCVVLALASPPPLASAAGAGRSCTDGAQDWSPASTRSGLAVHCQECDHLFAISIILEPIMCRLAHESTSRKLAQDREENQCRSRKRLWEQEEGEYPR